MRLSARELLLFVAKSLGALLGLALLWPLLAPAYSQLLAALAHAWLPSAQIQANAHQIRISLTAVQGTQLLTIHTTTILEAITFNMLLLTALMLATPRLQLRRRLAWTAAALLWQMGFHFLDITLSVAANYQSVVYGQQSLYGLAQIVGGLGEQASALIIWALLTFRHWLPLAPQQAPTSRPDIRTAMR